MSIREIVNKYASYLKEDKYDQLFEKTNKQEQMELINFLYSNCGINVLEKMTTIPDGLFMGVSLTGLTVPENITSIGNNAFKESSISEIYIPDSVVDIGYAAFMKCSNLRKIRLSRSITKLQTNLFKDCSSLEKIFIPDSVTTISSGVFDGCPKDILIVANFRKEENDKIKFPGSDVEFYRQHLKFKRN